MDFQGHFQQYFDYIMVDSFIDRGNRCTLIDETRDLPKVTHKLYIWYSKLEKMNLFTISLFKQYSTCRLTFPNPRHFICVFFPRRPYTLLCLINEPMEKGV